MSTTKSATFSEMLNEYLVYSDILEEAFKSQNWLMTNANMNPNWQGGKLIVPFQQALASSVKMGGLTADTDIDTALYVRGYLSGYKECYASLLFYSRDLFIDHYKISEQNFLKILPDQVEQTMKFMKQVVSIQVLNGPYLDTVGTAFVAATDVMAVAHPERFSIGQKLITSDGTTTVTGYLTAINKNTGVVTYATTRGGVTAVDLAGLVAANTKVYIDGGNSTAFGSLRDMLLPASAGGSDTFVGQTKLLSPFAQSVTYNAGGSSANTGDWNSAVIEYDDILNLVFDAYRKGLQLGAEPAQVLMSYKNFSACLKTLEKNSGAYKNIKPVVNFAGYSEIEVGGVVGSVTLVGIREMADDWMPMINKKYLDFHSGRKPFTVLTSPDGLKYYTQRATTGYSYITDIQLAGDFLYRAPWSAVAIWNIPNYAFNTLT